MAGKGIFIVGAKRTAFGTFGGTLKNVSDTELGLHASKAALEHAKVDPKDVDHVIFGNVVSSSRYGIFTTRHIGLRAGVPQEVGALTINRLCGSGFQVLINSAHYIKAGEAKIVLAGGTENMSQMPFVVRDVRFGTGLGKKYEFEDILWDSLTDPLAQMAMGQTAEKLGAQYNVTRQDADEFAYRSHQNWKQAQDAGVFKAEIAGIEVKGKKGAEVFQVDEHPKPGTTLEAMGRLKTVFKKDGIVTAGNASGIADGAAAMVVASEDAVKEKGLKPLARIVAYSAVGCDPTIMGIGPVTAIQNVLKESGVKMDDVDIFEVNEAFAPQAIAVQRALKIPMEKYNMNGGAVAIGHPLGASGARISAHIVHELHRKNVKYGIGSACIGGGQGIAVLFEKV